MKAAALVLLAGLLAPLAGGAAPLPDSTRAMLKTLKLDETILAGLDQELAVPRDWVEAARHEGTVRLTGSWQPRRFNEMVKPFNDRYPFIKIAYTAGSYNVRAVRPLIAFQEGRYIADMVTGVGSAVSRYEAADALDDISDMPAAAAVPQDMKGKDGRWIGIRLRYWCVAYNTEHVKTADLPKQWDDLVANPRWGHGAIGLTNIPDTWLLPLWGKLGRDWGEHFTDRLFGLDPQIRKEGANALIGLVSAGELDLSIPAGDHEMEEYRRKGAPVAWHCPQPIPTATSEMGILKGGPNNHAARIFANWILSKEGQIAQFVTDHSPPVHRDLQLPVFLLFPDQVIGKPTAFRSPDLNAHYEAFTQFWDARWEHRATP
jgi:iron(III) transport system substrate-binding protein